MEKKRGWPGRVEVRNRPERVESGRLVRESGSKERVRKSGRLVRESGVRNRPERVDGGRLVR